MNDISQAGCPSTSVKVLKAKFILCDGDLYGGCNVRAAVS